MDKLLEVFALDLRTRNKLRNIILYLRKHGKTADDFIEYANAMDEARRQQVAEQEKRQAEYKASLLPCPECKTLMILRPVNTGPGDQTGDDLKSVWFCTNKSCLHTEYSTKSIKDWKEL